jgi:L-lactate dehydrogenase complex protein LldG
MSGARAAILARIAAAAGRTEVEPPPRLYRRAGTLPAAARTALFCERAGEYRAEVRRTRPDGVAAAVRAACEARGARRLAVPAGLPAAWRPRGVELVEHGELGPHELDRLDGVVTGCTVAVAETGTIALAGGPAEGRRALTLVPDLHVCIVQESQIVELVPEAIALLGELVLRERRPLTLVSGPSATSDIELSRVEGVHGPRSLVVVVVS